MDPNKNFGGLKEKAVITPNHGAEITEG